MDYREKNETLVTDGTQKKKSKKTCCLFVVLLLIILQQTCYWLTCQNPPTKIEIGTATEAASTIDQKTSEILKKEEQDRIRRWKKATKIGYNPWIPNVHLDRTNDAHYIYIYIGGVGFSESSLISAHISEFVRLLKRLKKNNCLDGKNLHFIISTDVEDIDDYGNRSRHYLEVLEIAYSGDVLSKVNWKTIKKTDLFDLAGYVRPLHPIGTGVLLDYVSSDWYKSITPKFFNRIQELELTPGKTWPRSDAGL